MTILPIYAALLALLFVFLSVRTIRTRMKHRISIGDSGNEGMLRAMRVHSNFAEYVPLSLLLIFLVEEKGAYAWLVHALCLGLLIGRLSHAWGVSHIGENLRFRQFGMVLTFTTLITSAAYLLMAGLG